MASPLLTYTGGKICSDSIHARARSTVSQASLGEVGWTHEWILALRFSYSHQGAAITEQGNYQVLVLAVVIVMLANL